MGGPILQVVQPTTGEINEVLRHLRAELDAISTGTTTTTTGLTASQALALPVNAPFR